MRLPLSDVAVATDHLRSARTALDDAVAQLRLASRVDWDSAAAEAGRADVAALLGTLDSAAATVDQAVLVATGCEES
ncbi:hypothetical protein [Isoptericola aurantiacus]|uniref:hypothetical protein n=1 Tax=Isoptericola aurantiacus TaxID=3377839 RepID=UPI00383BB22B